jgi:periplasmic protein CpxP/Spy
MKRRSNSYAVITTATLSFIVLATPLAALAQSSPAPATAAAPAAVPAPDTNATPAVTKSMSVEVDQHIMLLHGQLGITTAEEPQWEQFANVMRQNAADMEQALASRSVDVTKMNAVDNMQSYAQLAQLHADNMQKLSIAFKSLYDSLPAKQQIVADKVFQQHAKKPMAEKPASKKPAAP